LFKKFLLNIINWVFELPNPFCVHHALGATFRPSGVFVQLLKYVLRPKTKIAEALAIVWHTCS